MGRCKIMADSAGKKMSSRQEDINNKIEQLWNCFLIGQGKKFCGNVPINSLHGKLLFAML